MVEVDEWRGLSPGARATLLEVLLRGPLPRAELARRLGLSRASLTRITRDLVDAGLLVEGGHELRSTTGRPSELLDVRADARRFVGVKLTGDASYAVRTDLRGRTQVSVEAPLPSRDVGDVVELVAAQVEELAAGEPVTALGVGLAGEVAKGGQLLRSPFLGWFDVPLEALLGQATGLPAAIENDVHALTAMEHWFGFGSGLESMALVTVGVGVGVGLVVHGRVVQGAHGKAGSLDHAAVDPSGPICAHGHRGCVSSYLPNEVIAHSARAASYQEAVERARAGDPVSRRAFADAGTALGALLAVVVHAVDPQKIVLTGDGLPVWELARPEIESSLWSRLSREAPAITLEVQGFDFSEWARAAAVTGVRRTLD